ncbi:MAG: hypothetical protein EBX40_08115, partial [Gammaproteobacteria bacterium]|nr:hypothetical protein [Gammaproteobacteria bacterium]
MAATVATSIFISREGLRASSQSTVSEFANMKLLCFGKADATLYREIASFKVLDPEQRVHKEPGSELEGISFSALYFRTYSHLYSAHLEECRLNVAKLVDQLFGRGAMRRLAESFNQECLHFFHDVVAEEAVKHHRIKGGFFIQNTREVLLLRVGKDRLQLKILNQLESIQGPGLQKIPLDAQTIVHARVLKSGIDVLGVNIRGLQAHLVSDFLMGKQFKRPLWKDMLKKAQHNPFKAMMLLASCAGMSAYGALLMGAEMEPLARIADLDGNAFEGFVSLLLTFQGAGMLSYFAARGARLVTAEWREKLEPMWVALKRIRQTRGHEDAIDEPGTVSELMILANEMNRPDSPLFYDKKRNASLTPTS